MSKIFDISQIIISILLIAAILIQSRGAGLAEVFGGSGEIFHTKRGPEKSLFILTIILSAIFIILAFLNILF